MIALGLIAAVFAHADPGVQVKLTHDTLQVTGAARPGPLTLALTGDRTANVSVLTGGRRVAGAAVSPGRAYRTTIPARAGEYVVAADGLRTTFTVSGPAVETPVPAADARITITDRGFELPAALPARGVVRVEQAATHTRAALAFRIARGLDTDTAVALVRKGRIHRVGTRFDLVGPVSPGTTNHVHVRLPRGRYLVVSPARHPLIGATRVR